MMRNEVHFEANRPRPHHPAAHAADADADADDADADADDDDDVHRPLHQRQDQLHFSPLHFPFS